MVVDADGLHTLEQFVLARYFLTTQVIRHKGRLITDSMLVRGLKLGVTVDGIRFLEKLYTFDGTEEFCREYVAWNDERLMSRLLEPEFKDTWAGRTARRLFERKLYKQVFARSLDQLSPTLGLEEPLRLLLPEVEGAVAEMLSSLTGEAVDPNEVILDVVKAPPPKKSEGSVLLKGVGRDRKYFENESVLFRSIDQTLQAESLQCYAPVALQDESKRQLLEGKVADLIAKRIERMAEAREPPANHGKEIGNGH